MRHVPPPFSRMASPASIFGNWAGGLVLMLRASRRGETKGAVDLAPEEDRLLRDAFGRYGGSAQARGWRPRSL